MRNTKDKLYRTGEFLYYQRGLFCKDHTRFGKHG